jgi:Uma2 family endonuclease
MTVLTLAEWDALPVDELDRSELVRGVRVGVAHPGALHQRAMLRLTSTLDACLPDHLTALPSVEVLVEAGPPATVRAPDVVVVLTSAADANPPRIGRTDVFLAVEIVSPGTRRTDRVTKPAEYADAGIPHYWLLELDPVPVLTAYPLVDGEYEIVAQGSTELELSAPAPAPVRLDVASLIARR